MITRRKGARNKQEIAKNNETNLLGKIHKKAKPQKKNGEKQLHNVEQNDGNLKTTSSVPTHASDTLPKDVGSNVQQVAAPAQSLQQRPSATLELLRNNSEIINRPPLIPFFYSGNFSLLFSTCANVNSLAFSQQPISQDSSASNLLIERSPAHTKPPLG